MSWGTCRGGGVILLSSIATCLTACNKQAPRTIATETQVERGLLFGTPQETLVATQIWRGDWPAVPNGYHAPQETFYIEYYRDYYGNQYQERNTPQKNFYSYKVGSSLTDAP